MEDGSQLRIDPIHFWNPGIFFVLSLTFWWLQNNAMNIMKEIRTIWVAGK